MDDITTLPYRLHSEPEDGRHPGRRGGSPVTRLPSASDENENQLDGGGCEPLTSRESAMGKPEVREQDSLNNNESCTAACEAAPSEDAQGTSWEAFLGQDRKTPGKRSPRSRRSPARKGLSSGDVTHVMQEDALHAATPAVPDESDEVNANEQPEAPRHALQSLFSLIRGEVEQLDSRALPLCLHQIAESYFQEEDYEQAMKFIQLERLYHEQLLANLSAIQEQWETKRKAVRPHAVTSLKNSGKGLNGEDLERLTKLCTTHQDPLLSKHKVSAVEKTPEGKSGACAVTASAEPEGRGVAAQEPESSACLGMEPGPEGPQQGTPQSHQPPPAGQADPQRCPPVTAGEAHEEEPLGSGAGSPALPAQPPAAEAARSRSGPHLPEAAGGEAAGAGAAAQDPGIEPALLPDPDRAPPALLRQELRLALGDAREALPGSQAENNELQGPRQPDLAHGDGRCAAHAAGPAQAGHGGASGLSAAQPMAPEGTAAREDLISKETEDYLNSLLEGCLGAAAGPFSCESPEEDPDLLQDLSPEEASYSLQDNPPADDSCLSLDDLARRIEIAEVVPAEGLVSILKKRNDTLGDPPAQMSQKPSKRRVRFQEIDDHPDQDEVGGGSCILLILLCIATVFLSVGGTALYCSLWDMESAMCTDFVDDMDFYYAKLLQGMAELKHWVSLS